MRKLSLRTKHLTQEHHAALLLAAAARDTMPQSEADLPTFAKKIAAIFDKEMEPHFREEERQALPKLRELGRDDLADRTLSEHVTMRAMIAQLVEEATAERVCAFAAAMEAHVEFEENVVWEVLEAAIDGAGQAVSAAA